MYGNKDDCFMCLVAHSMGDIRSINTLNSNEKDRENTIGGEFICSKWYRKGI